MKDIIIASKPGMHDLHLISSDRYLLYGWKNHLGATICGPYPTRMAAIEFMLNNGYTISKALPGDNG